MAEAKPPKVKFFVSENLEELETAVNNYLTQIFEEGEQTNNVFFSTGFSGQLFFTASVYSIQKG